MARYIDADKLNKEVISSWDNDKHKTIEASRVHRQEHNHLMRIIEKQPTADVVEVVRCKDCKYSREDKELCDIYGCTLFRDMRGGLDFCNYGEQKTKGGA